MRTATAWCYWAVAVLLLCAVADLGQLSSAAGQRLESPVWQIIRGNDLRQTTVSVTIVDLQTGQEVVGINADEAMIPASNMKLLTTAAALDVLGKDFKFQTRLQLIQPQDWVAHRQGAAETDRPAETVLVLTGDGDPALAHPDVLADHKLTVEDLLAELVRAVQAAGVERVDRLILDDRVFDRHFIQDNWPRDQLLEGYCAQVSGLNFHGNVVDISAEPTALGHNPRVVVKPHAPFIQIINRATTARSDHFDIDRRTGTNDFVLKGTLATRRSVPYKKTIHDPSMFAARLLADRLTRAGVQVRSVERAGDGETLPAGQNLYTIRTTLFEVVQRCNTDSINLFAEALLKRMGQRFTGVSGTWQSGGSAVRDFLRRRLGPASAVVIIDDGSGLSRENRITTRMLVKLLESMYRDPELRLDFIQSLAVAGDSGTIRGRLPGFQGRVYAKTGYINGVSAFSGYAFIPAEDGSIKQAYAFSLIFNNIPQSVRYRDIKAVQDQIVQLLDATAHVATAAD